jgi:prepilin-type N-terminal cleavage/methylation domain-containing protein
MITPRHFSARRAGFTLIELLTVIGIISLLIAIALPSFAKARDLAKKTTTLAELDSITKDLEMFQNAFGAYPDSSTGRVDPLFNLPNAPGDHRLSGAHWLARALAGPDQQGPDTAGRFMKDRSQVKVTGTQIEDAQSGGTGVDWVANNAAVRATDRKGTYFQESKLLSRDNDSSKFNTGSSPNTGRLVITDSFGWPILYYKANPRAQMPFWNSATSGDTGGVYDQLDNVAFTGGTSDSGHAQPSSQGYWDFASSGMRHGLGFFGPDQNTYNTNAASVESTALPSGSPAYKGKSFVDYLHDHKVHDTGGMVRSVLPETFLLISPGKDGIYGTEDDANNFSH